MTPKQAIDFGRMVRPRLHFIETKKIGHQTTENNNFIIEQTWIQHLYVLNNQITDQNSIDVDTGKKIHRFDNDFEFTVMPKLLIASNGTKDIERFLNSSTYEVLLKNDVNIFTISSIKGHTRHNDEHLDRAVFLSRLKEYCNDDTKQVLVMHYDILSEGIDVSGFTGVLLLRGLSLSKLVQTFGRIARVHPLDRSGIDSKTLDTMEFNPINWFKPYAWVVIPNLSYEDSEKTVKLTTMLNELRSYDFRPDQSIVFDDDPDGYEDEEITDLPGKKQKKKDKAGDVIEGYLAWIEAEKLANLTKEDIINDIFG
jgi:hypothetical protein